MQDRFYDLVYKAAQRYLNFTIQFGYAEQLLTSSVLYKGNLYTVKDKLDTEVQLHTGEIVPMKDIFIPILLA